jgi:uncharacterized glyoxalase superfamily protein PhnB
MKNIKLHSLSPNVIVDDVNKTVDYYVNNLGFNFITSVPQEGSYNWAMVMRDQVTVMFQSLQSLQEDLPELKIKQKGSIGTFFIEVDNIEGLYQSMKDKVTILGKIRVTFYGKKEFTIQDLNGYFLTFAEDVA